MANKAATASGNSILQSNFLFGILVLPKPQREAVKAVYAFCRAADDAVDVEPGTGAEGLARWREEVDLLFHSTPRTPVMQALFPFVRIHRLKREYFDRILEGFAMDLARRRYATVEE
ncbi:MAG: squalene/phytoene synthase family protein, partial [bacterium]